MNELLIKLAELEAHAKDLINKPDATVTEINAKLEEIQGVKAKIEAQKVLDELEAAKQTPVNKNININLGVKDDKHFDNLGDQLKAVALAGMGRGVDARLTAMNAASGMSEAVPADGGFLVQPEFITDLLKATYDTGILAPKCRRVPIGPQANALITNAIDETSRATGSRLGGVQVYRANEADTVTAKKPKFRRIELSLEKLMGLCYATDELLEDSTALENIISEAFAEEFGFRIDDEIIRGTGAGQCLGLLTAPALISQAKEGGQAADTIVAENIEKVYSRMPARSLGKAEWYINVECWPQLFQLSHAIGMGGVPLFVPAGGLSQAPFGTLLGRPINPIEQCSALGDAGDIVFADLNQYLLIEKGGIDAAQSIHVRFLYGENTFRFTYRINGQPIPKSAITPYKGNATQSPFIAIADRA